jgi:hypothetical protein
MHISRHTSAYVRIRPLQYQASGRASAGIRQHTSAYVRIRQCSIRRADAHQQAYVSIRQCSTRLRGMHRICADLRCAYLRPFETHALNEANQGNRAALACAVFKVSFSLCISRHTSAYVSIRQHTSMQRSPARYLRYLSPCVYSGP